MISIFPLTACNLNCKYCFSRYEKSTCSGSMSQDDIDSVFTYIKDNEPVIIMGGEPMLYDNLEYLVKKIIDTGHNVYIFTNGILAGSKVDILKSLKDTQSMVTLTLNPSTITGETNNSSYIESFNVLKENEIPITLKTLIDINYTDDDINALVDTIVECSPQSPIETGLASPGIEYTGSIDDFYNTMKPMLLSFLDKLIDKGVSYELRSCCQIPFCYFTDEEIKKYNTKPMNCFSQICIQPDFCVSSCFDLNYGKMTSYSSRDDIDTAVETKKQERIEALASLKSECKTCRRYLNHKCSIACVSFDKDYNKISCLS